MRKYIFLAMLLVLGSLYTTANDLGARKEYIKKLEVKISELAKKRKLRSETILKNGNVKVVV